ncbi:hypothetical protein DFH08DRAFT_939448 [Mycena albidolilacea]|uniref:Uncharacterized protein n=1 Tax=Mycena albidolilacea TaxID=1033008 RepID=A0AAD7EKL7_9AGAR|nr:hypothetical protein DFH08DRAFT_939448 [Mycena albidolilacea]
MQPPKSKAGGALAMQRCSQVLDFEGVLKESGSAAQIRIARLKSSGAIRASVPAAAEALEDDHDIQAPKLDGDTAQRIRHERLREISLRSTSSLEQDDDGRREEREIEGSTHDDGNIWCDLRYFTVPLNGGVESGAWTRTGMNSTYSISSAAVKCSIWTVGSERTSRRRRFADKRGRLRERGRGGPTPATEQGRMKNKGRMKRAGAVTDQRFPAQ